MLKKGFLPKLQEVVLLIKNSFYMTDIPYIYHIVPTTEWAQAEQVGMYAPASINTEGFIHCSKLEQVTGSAQLFFKGQSNLKLLQIIVAKLDARLVYENTTGGTELFPHLYGSLNLNAVRQVFDFNTDANGQFVLPDTMGSQ
ncbi:glutathione S-transferase domain protein [Microscilla marina ATCC 23134]|uniref:Glutathione S-transferase domain protein n=2 Tax=Microscilla marina TaxID=1027 RepID=A1ZRT9_MICM2|nr:glutathione S-transferase domain protein [Microscilla marina ATCC 23134]